jgi:hypothetical protein
VSDETAADDGAIYAVWDRFTLDEVRTAFDRLEALYRALVRLRGRPAPAGLVAEARDLRDGDHAFRQPWLLALAGP